MNLLIENSSTAERQDFSTLSKHLSHFGPGNLSFLVRAISYISPDSETGRVLLLLLAASDTVPAP